MVWVGPFVIRDAKQRGGNADPDDRPQQTELLPFFVAFDRLFFFRSLVTSLGILAQLDYLVSSFYF